MALICSFRNQTAWLWPSPSNSLLWMNFVELPLCILGLTSSFWFDSKIDLFLQNGLAYCTFESSVICDRFFFWWSRSDDFGIWLTVLWPFAGTVPYNQNLWVNSREWGVVVGRFSSWNLNFSRIDLLIVGLVWGIHNYEFSSLIPLVLNLPTKVGFLDLIWIFDFSIDWPVRITISWWPIWIRLPYFYFVRLRLLQFLFFGPLIIPSDGLWYFFKAFRFIELFCWFLCFWFLGESTTKGYIEFFDHVSANVAYTIINSYPSFRRFGTTAAWYLSNRSQVSGDNRVVARVVRPPPGLEVQRCVVAGHGGADGSFFQRALIRAPVAQKQTFKQAYERGPKPEIKLPVPGEPSAFAIRMAARRAKVDPANTAAIDPKADSTGARLLADEQRLQAEKGSLS